MNRSCRRVGWVRPPTHPSGDHPPRGIEHELEMLLVGRERAGNVLPDEELQKRPRLIEVERALAVVVEQHEKLAQL